MSEQDINQRQADATGLVQSARSAGDGRPYLGDQAVLDGLARQLVADVFGRFEQVAAGDLSPADASSADQEACHQMARTLIGENPDYAPVPGWSEAGLANSIRRWHPEAIQEGEDDLSVVAQVIAMFVHQLYQEAAGIVDGDEAMAQGNINELIRSFVWLLLGVQSNE